MTIIVTDQSETVIPEIAWGKDLNTGEWSCSMDFSDNPWEGVKEYEECEEY